MSREKKKLDKRAKEIILKKWSKTPNFSKQENRPWLRCQPPERSLTHPRLRIAGTTIYPTQPDGLYILLGNDARFADCFAIEVCGSEQNLNDKRSRYAPSTCATVIEIPLKWLKSPTFIHRPWWETSKAFNKSPEADIFSPVRHLRVLYVLSNDIYSKVVSKFAGGAHEFFIPITSLNSITSQKFKKFLERISPVSQYYSHDLTYLSKQVFGAEVTANRTASNQMVQSSKSDPIL